MIFYIATDAAAAACLPAYLPAAVDAVAAAAVHVQSGVVFNFKFFFFIAIIGLLFHIAVCLIFFIHSRLHLIARARARKNLYKRILRVLVFSSLSLYLSGVVLVQY